MIFTLSQLANALATAEVSAVSVLKAALLNDAVPGAAVAGTLSLGDARELAHFTAVCTLLATQSNGKPELNAILAQGATDLSTAFAEFEQTRAWQRFSRKNGELILQDGTPVLELDPVKLAEVLRTPATAFKALASVDIPSLVTSTGFCGAFAGQVSHPTKLSAGRGAGGFYKTEHVAVPVDFASVTEEDFHTRETATLSGSAGFQKMWWLLLPLIQVEGETHRLASFFGAHPAVANDVATILNSAGVSHATELMDALSAPARPAFSGEPQVFCGDLPNAERLSVLAPFGMFNEMSRARKTLERAYESERDGLLDRVDADIAALDAEVVALRDTPAVTKEAKQKAQQRKAELAALLKDAKAKKRALAAKYLNIPKFNLPIGGAVPRNIAMDLDVSLHTANVRVYVPSPRKVVHLISPKAFVAESLIARPRVHLRTLPAYLKAESYGAKHNRARRALFTELVAVAMMPLLTLRDEWQERAKVIGGAVALSTPAQGHIAEVEASKAPWAMFVKGDDALNQKDAMVRLAPLVRDIAGKVSQALHDALADMPATFDGEIKELAAAAVQMEKA